MSLKHETVSILICREESTTCSEINFLMQIAWYYAEKGSLVFILSRKVIDSDSGIQFTGYISKPEILQRIIFRYFTESTELLTWCHEIHKHSRIPTVLILSGLENFSESNEFNSVEICAALLDSVQYCSRYIKKATCLLVSACNENKVCQYFVPFFDKIWFLENTETEYILSQFFPSFPGEPQKRLKINQTYL